MIPKPISGSFRVSDIGVSKEMSLTLTDAFCGAGGASEGYRQAGIELRCGINHWNIAIQTHSINFPGASHLCCGIDKINPGDLPTTDVFHMSPECTHFARARGNRPKSESSRSLAWQCLPLIEHHRYRWVTLENVVEFEGWEAFWPFVCALESYGYRVRFGRLNSADFGAHTSRERFFLVGRLSGDPVWPEPTHSGKHNPFVAVVNRGLPLQSVHGRKKPLCETTMKWIERGREMFGESTWIHGYYGNATLTPITKPLPTITTRDRFALVDATSGELATRMLDNTELAAAQGFPVDYQFCGTKRDITKQIGNSVPPAFCAAIGRAIVSVENK